MIFKVLRWKRIVIYESIEATEVLTREAKTSI